MVVPNWQGGIHDGRWPVSAVGDLRRRLVVYVASLFALLAVYTLTYRWGMAVLEGEQRTWYQALEVVVQSMTTTGYGQDAPWETAWMTALVVLIQVTGIGYILVAIPQFVVPWLETLVQPRPPTEIEHVEEHVIIVGYTDLCDTLVSELDAVGTPYVVLEPDEDRAQDLHEDGFQVLYGDPEDDETLKAAQLDEALAVVVDATERDLVRAVLAIEHRNPEATVLPLVSEPGSARYFRYAGADEVLSPKHRLGKALGDRVRDVVVTDLGPDLELGEAFGVEEFLVDPDSDLFGEPAASVGRLEHTGATVLGAWVRGDFVTTLSEQVTIDENTSVLVVGTADELEGVADLAGATGNRYRTAGDPVVVVGAGLVGRTAFGTLERADLETVVVDCEGSDIVDVVGDPTEEETLLDAGIEDAGTVLVALDDDDDAIRVTLTARALTPGVEILVGANTSASVTSLRTAGADYVLSLPNVAGRMVTLRAFGRDVMRLREPIHLRGVRVPELLGQEVSPTKIEQESDCTVVALERDGEFHSEPDGMEIGEGDRLIVVGRDDQLERFTEMYGRGERQNGPDPE